MSVEYRDIEGFPGYRVGNDGTIWSKREKCGRPSDQWRRLEPIKDCRGRPKINLCNNGKRKQAFIHALVLEAFVGPRPKGMHTCHFPDRDVTNNRLGNLRWGTAKENCHDKIIHGTIARGERDGNARLSTSQVLEIREQLSLGLSLKKLAKKFGVGKSTVLSIKKRDTWKHV